MELNFSNSLLILAVRAAIAEKKIDCSKIKFTYDEKEYIILSNGRFKTYPPCMFEEYIDKILGV